MYHYSMDSNQLIIRHHFNQLCIHQCILFVIDHSKMHLKQLVMDDHIHLQFNKLLIN